MWLYDGAAGKKFFLQQPQLQPSPAVEQLFGQTDQDDHQPQKIFKHLDFSKKKDK